MSLNVHCKIILMSISSLFFLIKQNEKENLISVLRPCPRGKRPHTAMCVGHMAQKGGGPHEVLHPFTAVCAGLGSLRLTQAAMAGAWDGRWVSRISL